MKNHRSKYFPIFLFLPWLVSSQPGFAASRTSNAAIFEQRYTSWMQYTSGLAKTQDRLMENLGLTRFRLEPFARIMARAGDFTPEQLYDSKSSVQDSISERMELIHLFASDYAQDLETRMKQITSQPYQGNPGAREALAVLMQEVSDVDTLRILVREKSDDLRKNHALFSQWIKEHIQAIIREETTAWEGLVAIHRQGAVAPADSGMTQRKWTLPKLYGQRARISAKSQNAQAVAVVLPDETVYVLSLNATGGIDPEPLLSVNPTSSAQPSFVTALGLSADGKVLAIGHNNGASIVHGVDGKGKAQTFSVNHEIKKLAVFPECLITLSGDNAHQAVHIIQTHGNRGKYHEIPGPILSAAVVQRNGTPIVYALGTDLLIRFYRIAIEGTLKTKQIGEFRRDGFIPESLFASANGESVTVFGRENGHPAMFVLSTSGTSPK